MGTQAEPPRSRVRVPRPCVCRAGKRCGALAVQVATLALRRELSGTWSRKASFHPSPSFQNPHKQRLPEDLLSSSWKKSPFCGQPTTVGTKCQRQSCPWQRRACVQADQGHPGQRLASSATPWPGSGTRRPALRSCPRSIAGWGVLWGGAPQPLLLHSPETGPVGDPHPPHQAAVRVRVPLLTGMRKQCGQGQRQGLSPSTSYTGGQALTWRLHLPWRGSRQGRPLPRERPVLPPAPPGWMRKSESGAQWEGRFPPSSVHPVDQHLPSTSAPGTAPCPQADVATAGSLH